ncbi:hypothetical protein HYU09_01100 [Candidatus Woesearchaeota archaeon]|nr:hypothetical protein [Candidatus Woesearchaeota archaeon]
MYASGENISARVSISPIRSAEPSHIGNVLEGIGFREVKVDRNVRLWEQIVRHQGTSTPIIRRVSYSGNGHYNAFVLVEGSTPTAVRAMAEFGDTPEERLRKYLQHNLEGFVVGVLAHYFEIEDLHQ